MFAAEEYLHQLLRKAIAAGASDVHLKVGQPPGVRVASEIAYFKTERLMPEDTEAAAGVLLGGGVDAAVIDSIREFDGAYTVAGVGRFRVNIFRQRSCLSVVLRVIPLEIPSLEALGLPPAVRELARRPRGLVLVVGAAGNGKSTTLAAMVHELNATHAHHIVTIEDPIEFIHTDLRSCVSQREVGIDTPSFAAALRASLRQDPDVIVVGEIRDAESMDIVVQAAETGHLVLSTLHTPNVARTLNRMLALSDNPGELRERLGDCLQGIVAQRLVPKVGGGVVPAVEVLVVTGTVREALKRPEQNPSLKELMERGITPYGMQTFQMSFRELMQRGSITKESASQHGS